MNSQTEQAILSRLSCDPETVQLHVFDSVTSTNDLLREAAANGAPEFTVYAAKQQTAGKGRQGRAFYSPPQTGLYLSILLKPLLAPADALMLTPLAAVAAADAVERCTGQRVQIKWVNDLLLHGKKICGILIENQLKGDSIKQSIIGIGLNVNQTRFVSDAPNPVSLAQLTGQELDREQLLRELAQSLGHHLDMLGSASAEHALYEDYLDSLYRVHKDCLYRFPDGTERECRLEVVYEDGRMALSWQTEKESQTDRQVGIFAFKEVQFVI